MTTRSLLLPWTHLSRAGELALAMTPAPAAAPGSYRFRVAAGNADGGMVGPAVARLLGA